MQRYEKPSPDHVDDTFAPRRGTNIIAQANQLKYAILEFSDSFLDATNENVAIKT